MDVVLERTALDALRTLAPTPKRRVKAALAELALRAHVEPGSDRVKRLDAPTVGEPVYRLRIGDYRAVYVIRRKEVKVLRVFHRQEGYRWLERLGLE